MAAHVKYLQLTLAFSLQPACHASPHSFVSHQTKFLRNTHLQLMASCPQTITDRSVTLLHKIKGFQMAKRNFFDLYWAGVGLIDKRAIGSKSSSPRRSLFFLTTLKFNTALPRAVDVKQVLFRS
jgi:alpha-D-ribose 1-methylphosphonate 5-triphosphate synthase subunit PhnH